jgi:hypothetical protein
MTSTLTALTEIGNSLGVDTAAPFKHDEVWKSCIAPLGLLIRDSPNRASKMVGWINFNAPVHVLESSNGWARIGDNQWCSETYLG